LPCRAKVRPFACAVPRTVLRSAKEHRQRTTTYGLRPAQRRSPGTRSRSLRRRRPHYCPDLLQQGDGALDRFEIALAHRRVHLDAVHVLEVVDAEHRHDIATTAPRAWLSVKIEESSITPSAFGWNCVVNLVAAIRCRGASGLSSAAVRHRLWCGSASDVNSFELRRPQTMVAWTCLPATPEPRWLASFIPGITELSSSWCSNQEIRTTFP